MHIHAYTHVGTCTKVHVSTTMFIYFYMYAQSPPCWQCVRHGEEPSPLLYLGTSQTRCARVYEFAEGPGSWRKVRSLWERSITFFQQPFSSPTSRKFTTRMPSFRIGFLELLLKCLAGTFHPTFSG